ncbi:hypothetical protein TWF730_006873 [Orbilia blumenaviensis]|uniref:Uncharacterized protein n=1 Tax=Orbilia blumenaviensis TaxID=1796055 RepID=A0AAV9VGS6_9PEZI
MFRVDDSGEVRLMINGQPGLPGLAFRGKSVPSGSRFGERNKRALQLGAQLKPLIFMAALGTLGFDSLKLASEEVFMARSGRFASAHGLAVTLRYVGAWERVPEIQGEPL